MINSIKFDESLKSIQKNTSIAENTTRNASGSSFADMLKESVSEINQSNKDADKLIADFATGKNTDIHNTMIAIEKADISFQLMMQIRNKLVAAYQEVYRMQV
jgi:flagellar hook-basal body complex protein FliE